MHFYPNQRFINLLGLFHSHKNYHHYQHKVLSFFLKMFSSFIYLLLSFQISCASVNLLNGCNCAIILFKYNKSYAEFNNIYEDTFDPFFCLKYFYTRYKIKFYSYLSCKFIFCLKCTHTHTHKIYIPIILFCLLLLSSSYYDYGKNILLQNRLMSFNKWINFIYCSLHKRVAMIRIPKGMRSVICEQGCTFLVGLLFVFWKMIKCLKIILLHYGSSIFIKGMKCCK